jgi:hypothetical protein
MRLYYGAGRLNVIVLRAAIAAMTAGRRRLPGV